VVTAAQVRAVTVQLVQLTQDLEAAALDQEQEPAVSAVLVLL
jgi:hypothetical protein